MTYISSMRIMAFCIHVSYVHSKRSINIFHHINSIFITLFFFTNNTGSSPESASHSSFRTTVFSTPHRMCCNKTLSHRVIFQRLAQCIFCRTGIGNNLFFIHQFHYLLHHRDSNIDGNCNINKITLFYCIFQWQCLINNSKLQCFIKACLCSANTNHFFCKAFFFHGKCK